MSTGPGDQDQFQVRRRDDALEQTADSQEKAVDIAAPEAAPTKPSTSTKKKASEQEFVLVSSSDGPSNNHVSLNKISNLCFVRLTISSPRG
jgi:cytoskeletal protein RodZ